MHTGSWAATRVLEAPWQKPRTRGAASHGSLLPLEPTTLILPALHSASSEPAYSPHLCLGASRHPTMGSRALPRDRQEEAAWGKGLAGSAVGSGPGTVPLANQSASHIACQVPLLLMMTLIWALPRELQDFCTLLDGANLAKSTARSNRFWLALSAAPVTPGPQPALLSHPFLVPCPTNAGPRTKGRGSELSGSLYVLTANRELPGSLPSSLQMGAHHFGEGDSALLVGGRWVWIDR